MVANPPQPPQRGNGGTHPSSEGSSTIYGMETVELQTRAKTYGNPIIEAQKPGSSLNPTPPNDIYIESLVADPIIRPPKATL